MSANVIRKLFAKDIDAALEEARQDERDRCREEYRKKIAEEISKTEGRLTLEIKKKESELKSQSLRLQMAEERMKATEIQRQEMRELAVTQRQIMSDLVHVMKDWQERRLEELQPFTRLESMALDVEKRLLKIGEA